HKEFNSGGIRGVVMGSSECADRMVIAVPQMAGVEVDLQSYFCLNRLKQDLLLNDNGSFYEKRKPILNQDYGAAISLTFTLEPKATVKIPFAFALDFPQQRYIDGKTFDRTYIKSFKDKETRAVDMVKLALGNYSAWLDGTITIQTKIFELIQKNPSYKKDKNGALRLARLIFNEFSFPLSNAAAWVEDDNGNERARFLECFDYAYIDPSDVDWYSMVLMALFPNIEREICQSFVDSILAEDPTPRYYHYHSSFVEARKHFQEHPEEYEGQSLIQIRDKFKIKGSVAHDLSAMPKGHPLRNVSDYAWYNNNYWVDLFPKLVLRVLRNVKFMEDMDFLRKNWEALKFGFEFLQTLDIDGDGIPEGNPHEVKNTFDNLTLFGVDSYDATTYMAGCRAMSIMADMMGDASAKEKFQASFEKADKAFEKLWREHKNKKGTNLQYYVTCYDPITKKMNKDVWTNQLDALWYLIAIGEESFIPADKAKKILKTIYKNNKTYMGWAMCRTENGGPVESEQGQDVYTTSNYVFAQLLDYYGLTKESKEVYKAMDKVIFKYANSLISPDNLRAELEQEEGESAPGPHYIVAAYPRPGAVFTQIVLQYIKELQKKTNCKKIDSKYLKSFVSDLLK
ncbi:MAG TPA: GH116 family glycosyl hydrolase, partial [Ignavibacteriaceae bacterium]|nr:GH116 family glycosyl hydrolase [Ignavibacteriaceae bacterium]